MNKVFPSEKHYIFTRVYIQRQVNSTFYSFMIRFNNIFIYLSILISGLFFRLGRYEEWRLLGCYAVWFF
jgi:hypothetical protein